MATVQRSQEPANRAERRAVARGRTLASMTEAAAIYGVNPRTIRRYIADGRVTGYRVGPKLLRVDLDELDAVFTVQIQAGA